MWQPMRREDSRGMILLLLVLLHHLHSQISKAREMVPESLPAQATKGRLFSQLPCNAINNKQTESKFIQFNVKIMSPKKHCTHS